MTIDKTETTAPAEPEGTPTPAPISQPVYVLMRPEAKYGADVWKSWRGSELRMRTRYLHGRECSYRLLWQGPGGSARRDERGPLVPGPFGAMIPQDVIVSDSPREAVVAVDVEPGADVLLILVEDPDKPDLVNAPKVLARIVDDRPADFPHLVALS